MAENIQILICYKSRITATVTTAMNSAFKPDHNHSVLLILPRNTPRMNMHSRPVAMAVRKGDKGSSYPCRATNKGGNYSPL
uniref:hypothetical protein n=2 Tax=Thiolapillus sp. TaxID=2017437 RepID=UPI0025F995EA